MIDALYEEALSRVRSLVDEATATGDPEPTAMTVSTLGKGGRLSSRVVLLKALDERGFVFYTNFQSLKGRQLQANPQAALVFLWKDLAKQVRVEGRVEVVPSSEADQYFASRARGSQIGAWASQQSQVLADRRDLEERIRAFEQQFDGGDVPRPPHWSGFRVVPKRIEIWSGRQSRLHDRWSYRQNDDESWSVDKLYP